MQRALALTFPLRAARLLLPSPRAPIPRRLQYSYLPRSLSGFQQFERQQELFGAALRVEEFKVDRADGGDVLQRSVLDEALKLSERVADELKGPMPNGTAVVLDDICERVYEGGPCLVDNLFRSTPLGAAYDTLSDDGLRAFLYARRDDLGRWVGGLQVDEGAERVSGSSLRFYFLVSPVDNTPRAFVGPAPSSARAERLAWEAAFLNAVNAPDDGNGLRLQGVAGRSLDDEIARNVQGSVVFMVLAVTSILLYMAALLGGAPPYDSRLLLGCGAVATILLAELAGFGLAALAGIPLTDLSLLIVFIVVGIGVDDVIVLVDFVNARPSDEPLPERLARGLAGAGSAIWLTSFTNLIAFSVAASVDFPGVRWFCAAAGLIVFVLFLLSATFFAALLHLDARRRQARRYDCLVCFGGGDAAKPAVPAPAAPGPSRARAHKAFAAYGRCITHPLAALLVVGAFCALIPVGFLVAVPNLEIGVEFEDNFPDKSYLAQYYIHTDDYFESLVSPFALSFERGRYDLDWADAAAQARVLKLAAQLDEHPLSAGPVRSWLADFRTYAARAAAAGASPPPTSSGGGFYADLRAWLERTDPECVDAQCSRAVIPRAYNKDIVWEEDDDGEQRIRATRLQGQMETPGTLQGRIDAMDAMKAAAAEAGAAELGAVLYSYFFIFSERDAIVLSLISSTLLSAAGAVLAVLLLFLHAGTVALIAVGIAGVDGGLFIMMMLWDVPIDIGSFICLAIAVGLSVDYVVHVAHAFEHAHGSGAERAVAALEEIGGSVFKGGASTFLGIVLLAGSESEVFRIFFKMLVTTVALGLLTGLVFFPAAASLVGRWIPPKASGADDRAARVEAARHAELEAQREQQQQQPEAAAPAAAPPASSWQLPWLRAQK